MVEERTRELKNAHEDLLLSERLATLGQFSGSISHELRNPLGVIDSSIYFLKRKLVDSDGKVHEHLDRIKASVDNSIETIQSILDLTRMKKPKLERINLILFISEVIGSFKVPQNVKIIREFSDEEILIDADFDQLEMTFNNIMKNAVEAMNRKGELTVLVDSDTDGFVEVSFKDTGLGIKQKDIKKIFQPLFSTKVKGIGFGLSISKMIVERHGGHISADSEPGKGTTVTVKLPIYSEKDVEG
jgi:signal transduction histidine kinase